MIKSLATTITEAFSIDESSLDAKLSKLYDGSEQDLLTHSMWQLFSLTGPSKKGKPERDVPLKLLVIYSNFGKEAGKFTRNPGQILKAAGTEIAKVLNLTQYDADDINSNFRPRSMEVSHKLSDLNDSVRTAEIVIHVNHDGDVLNSIKLK